MNTNHTNISLRKTMAGLAAIPVLYIAQALMPEFTMASTISMARLGEKPGTAILTATPPVIDKKNYAHFTIDISKMGFFRKINFAGSDFTALIFNGSHQDSKRACPFFNLKARNYTIEEIRPNIFQVRTLVTAEEKRRVAESGCIITTAPDRKKIKYLPS